MHARDIAQYVFDNLGIWPDTNPRNFTHTIFFHDEEHHLLYKVVTPDWWSLELNRNPNALEYALRKWSHHTPRENPRGDDKGIWAYRRPGGANESLRYLHKIGREGLSLICAGGNILHEGKNGRVAVDRLMPLLVLPER